MVVLLVLINLPFLIFLDIVVKKNPKYEDVVRVKFEDKIFRAKVIGKSEETYLVFLIDIGKQINVSADNIFDISNDLKNVCKYFEKKLCAIFESAKYHFIINVYFRFLI